MESYPELLKKYEAAYRRASQRSNCRNCDRSKIYRKFHQQLQERQMRDKTR